DALNEHGSRLTGAYAATRSFESSFFERPSSASRREASISSSFAFIAFRAKGPGAFRPASHRKTVDQEHENASHKTSLPRPASRAAAMICPHLRASLSSRMPINVAYSSTKAARL